MSRGLDFLPFELGVDVNIKKPECLENSPIAMVGICL